MTLLIAGCSRPLADAARGDNVTVVSGAANAPLAQAHPVPRVTPSIAKAAVPSPARPLAMPLPRYVPAPPLSPALQAAEDDIRQAAEQSLATQQQDSAKSQPPAV